MLRSEGLFEPVVVDHVCERANCEVEWNGHNEGNNAGADIFIEKGVFRPKGFELPDDEARVTGVGFSSC